MVYIRRERKEGVNWNNGLYKEGIGGRSKLE